MFLASIEVLCSSILDIGNANAISHKRCHHLWPTMERTWGLSLPSQFKMAASYFPITRICILCWVHYFLEKCSCTLGLPILVYSGPLTWRANLLSLYIGIQIWNQFPLAVHNRRIPGEPEKYSSSGDALALTINCDLKIN